MPRKGHTQKRDVLADPMYNNKVVTKLINNIMLDGKKGVAQKIVYGAFARVEEKAGKPAIEVFEEAMNNIMPVLEVKARRIGGATYQVPIEVRADRRQALALRWLTMFSRKRGEKTIMRKGLNVDNEKMMYSLIRRSSVNKAMDYKKKPSSRHEFVCTEDISEILEVRRSVDAEEVILRKEKKEFMYMVLERFREEQPLNYEILIQVKYLDIPVEIVAEEFGLTKSGVNNRIYKAKRWLKEEFRKVYE